MIRYAPAVLALMLAGLCLYYADALRARPESFIWAAVVVSIALVLQIALLTGREPRLQAADAAPHDLHGDWDGLLQELLQRPD